MASHNPPPGKVKMTVHVDPEQKKRLKRAATDFDMDMQDIVSLAVEEWLKERGR